MGNIDGLAGSSDFRKQIMAGNTAEQIRETWEPGLLQYRAMREKYIIYP